MLSCFGSVITCIVFFFFFFFFFFFLMGSSSPTPIPFFFFFLSFFFFFFVFFFFCRQNNFKISKLQIKFANQSGTHTVPKHATFHPPMHSYHVFHRRVERPSIAGIGCAPEVALKKKKGFAERRVIDCIVIVSRCWIISLCEAGI